MARTKRKVNPLVPMAMETVPQQRVYKTGGYVRLSVEDSGKPGADTIEAQKELVLEYIETQPDMEFCGLYCDNGRTGTNFQRPEFERLMDDVRAGKIDCIVVKDLSRFGRNYKETGQYLEQIFPFLDVRFVAVNDSFDTLTAERSQDGYIVPLKNIMNEVYSRDISRNVSSALQTKQRNGEFIGAWAPYGYRKCPSDKHKIEPDPSTAPIVRDIFRLRAGGMSFNKIAKHLNDSGVPTPAQYKRQTGEIQTDRYVNARWNIFTLKNILESEVYIGNLVQGRKISGLCQGQKQRRTSKEEWIIVKNTHEPLVDRETFRQVQELAQKASETYKKTLGKYDHLDPMPNILRGLVFCADCGKPLTRYKQVTHGKHLYYTYICPTHHADSTACPRKYLYETKLKEVLWGTLRREIQLAENVGKLVKVYEHSPAILESKSALEQELRKASQALERYKTLHDSLYENYVDGLMDEWEYTEMKRQYRSQMEQAQARLDELEQQKASRARQTTRNLWLTACSHFADETGLTEEITHALIQRVEVDASGYISITLRYQDEFQNLVSILQTAGKKESA